MLMTALILRLISKENGLYADCLNGITGRESLSAAGTELRAGELCDLTVDGETHKILSAVSICDFYDGEDKKLTDVVLDVVCAAATPERGRLILKLLLFAYKKKSAETDKKVFLIKFLLSLFKAKDLRFSMDRCRDCGIDLKRIDYVGFDPGRYGMKCLRCSDGGTFELKKRTFAEFSMIETSDFDSLNTIKICEGTKDYLLFLLGEAIALHFVSVPSLEEIIRTKIL